MNIPLRLFVLAACLGAGISVAAPRNRPFKVTVLHPLPGHWQATVNALNDSGDVGGSSSGTGTGSHAALWPHGTTVPQALSELPGTSQSAVQHINNLRVAVGNCLDPSLTPHAVMWDSAGVHQLEPLPGQAYASVASVNDRGQAVGLSGNHAALWDQQGVHDLGLPAGADTFQALAINQRGDILLMAHVNDGSPAGILVHYVLSRGQLLRTNLPVDTNFFGTGISDNKTVVGVQHLAASGLTQALSWRGGKVRQLRPLPGDTETYSVAISSSGTIIGLSDTSTTASRLVAWEGVRAKSLAPRIAEDPAYHLYEPVAINRRGQILGFGSGAEEVVGFILTP